MSAINPSTLETEFISPSFSVLKLKENSIDLDEDFLGSDLEDDLVSSPEKSYSNGTTTDLVRLYLQDIGRVPLLKRDEEVEQAQQVQRHRKFGSETPPFYGGFAVKYEHRLRNIC